MSTLQRCESSPAILMTPFLEGPKVLVLGYSEIYRDVLDRSLKRRGYTPLLAATSIEGLQQFKLHQKICLVLIGLGFGLCTEEGAEAVRAMRAHERRWERFTTSIIANTHYPALDEKPSIEAGADECVKFTGSLKDIDNVLKKYAVYF